MYRQLFCIGKYKQCYYFVFKKILRTKIKIKNYYYYYLLYYNKSLRLFYMDECSH